MEDDARLAGLAALSGEPGGMIERVKAFDWAATPLGVPATWPAELMAAASLVLESRFPSALVWGEHGTTIYNDAFRPILGDKSEALGRPFSDIWQEAWDTIGPIARKAFDGEATFIEDFPLDIDRHGYPEKAYFTFCYSPVRAADGTVCGMIDTVIETTETVQANAREKLVNGELGHRLKNTMSMVQAIATQSLKSVPDRAPVEAFKDRIIALGRAHDVLLRESWDTASIASVVAALLSLHGGQQRFVVGGPPVELGPKAVLSLSLLLHELSTNAAKYGAFLLLEGQVSLTWRIEGEGEAAMLVVDWKESGGPPPVESGTGGFGSRLINMACAEQGLLRSIIFNQGSRLNSGLHCTSCCNRDRP